MVCTGNICRSAYAENALQTRLDSVAPRLAETASAGTHPNQALHVPDPLLRLAADAGVRGLERHRPRRVEPGTVEQADLVLTASRRHMTFLLQETPRAIGRTFTVLELAAIVRALDARTGGEWIPAGGGIPALADAAARSRSLARGPGIPLDIADPYGRSDEAYAAMVEVMDPALDVIAAALAEAVSGTPSGPPQGRP